MGDSWIRRFFGVATRADTWLNVVFQWLSFPLGLFYFIFLTVGLSLGVGLVVVWVGIPILLVMAGAWWLFGAFERVQAKYLLRAEVPPAPRSWESVDGVWAKIKAHFGNGATWLDLVYLVAKLPFGIVATTLVTTAVASVAWLLAMPFAWLWNVQMIDWSSGGWTPAWWAAVLAVPAGVLLFFAWLHVLNGWGWICARWAEVLLGSAKQPPRVAPAQPAPLVSTAPVQPAPLVSTAPPTLAPATPPPPAPPQPPAAPPTAPPASPPPAAEAQPPVAEDN